MWASVRQHDILNCVKTPLGESEKLTPKNVLMVNMFNPTDLTTRTGAESALLLSSHRWDALRHMLRPAVSERERETERRGVVTNNESIISAVGCCSPVVFT